MLSSLSIKNNLDGSSNYSVIKFSEEINDIKGDMLPSPIAHDVSSFLKFVHVTERDNLLSDLYETVNSLTSRCVLIEGESGCGKTKILRVLADMCNKSDNDIVTIHIGEQLDSKVLIGTFTCSGMPGEFVWLPGILTQSVLAGKWVFLEDIDHTPSDVLSLLLPLIKEGKLVLPGYTSPVYCGKEFKLFATRRLSSHGIRPVGPNVAMLNILENHMTKFSISQYTLEDLIQIIGVSYLSVVSILPAINNTDKTINIRKLYSLGIRLTNIIHNGKVTDSDDLMLEVLDVLAGDLPGEERLKIGLELRSICGGMSTEKVEYLCLQYKPVVQVAKTSFTVGRAFLNRLKEVDYNPFFAHTRSSLVLLEKVGRCVQLNEPVLLVGETGVGKTATISYLATMTGNTLVTINLSQQTDSTDLLGGFKPVQLAQMLTPLRDTFNELFCKTFDLKKTSTFLSNVQAVIVEKNWKKLLDVFIQSVKIAQKKIKGKNDLELKWEHFEQQVKKTRKQLDLPQASLAFQFVEGALVEAVRKGWWVLLDEVNLASPEALQCLNSLLEGPEGTFLLTEKLDSHPIKRHPDFRLFCCMNPATDIGKKSLPPSVRNRFSEFYVDELKDPSDLRVLITRYLSECRVTPPIINGIIKFYTSVRELADTKLQDGTGRRPHYSLRTLCRSLFFAAKNPCKNILRSLYEGFLMSFLTQLKFDHHVVIAALAKQALNIPNTTVTSPLQCPKEMGVVKVEGFWLDTGTEVPEVPTGYVITNSVRCNLKNLARIVFGRKLPILLQGPTSAGKTSLIRYLACLTGHKCLRVNNHEHTDLQEYVGMYSAGPDGQLVFQEGVLVEAMRNGYWIILDELNLAPTDVLEALNRVLDDNRELFIPETQQLIKAHPHFMLFGTQNPPGVYGGRKVLSRAFRNRFVELHFEDIPSNELVHILNQCSALPEAYAKKMVSVMKNLQQRRSVSGVFEGKYGLITLRDLFRWAGRYRMSSVKEKFYDWEQHLAEDGFMLLSGRLRNDDEIIVIKEVIEKQFKRTVNPSNLFGWDGGKGGVTTNDCINLFGSQLPEEFEHVVWTPELMRMGVLVYRAIKFQEPVLLVGNTGCGKTTLCQLLMKILNKTLYIINCHMHTEAADFLGGLRPIRNRTEDTGAVQNGIEDTEMESDSLALFEWCDGILVKSMREGGCVLLDEISLAEDAVLERLNSVLEPERKLLVAERGKDKEQVYEVVAQDGFLLLATMNPGGDYGKKELSPALRNRFVEIWCHDITTTTGYRMIINHNLRPQIKDLFQWSDKMVEFIDWLKQLTHSSKMSVTTRDVIMWITFINKVTPPLSPPTSFYHGAQSMFIDAIGCGGCGLSERKEGQEKCEQMLKELASDYTDNIGNGGIEIRNDCFGIDPFYIERGPLVTNSGHYCLTATGPLRNAFRLLRAMQLGRPLMLEGDPGVGKTSIVSALAAAGGHSLTRINLSEHTDISDLFGSDLPTEGDGERQKMRFAWRDGPFLKALKNSEWILLDEMNLASQSVLEGLNACLDHRGEVFIPELNKTFSVPNGTRLFACQNPYRDGGGRKGLPMSFINRFIQVYMESMSHDDLVTITCSLYPDLDKEMIQKMVIFNDKVRNLVSCHGDTQGCDFNLRDILRWCELIKNGGGDYKRCINNPGEWVNLLYLYRIRDNMLRKQIMLLYCQLFGEDSSSLSPPGQHFIISNHMIQIGSTCLTRGHYRHGDNTFVGRLLPCQLPVLDAMLQSVSMNWMTILIGDGCSGKSTLIKSLAVLTGHKLLEYPMNTATDTMELLGGYEQVNISRHCCNLVSNLLDITKCIYTEHLMIRDNDGLITSIIDQFIPYCIPRVTSLQDDNNDLANRIMEIKRATEELLSITYQTESKYINDLNILLSKTDELLSKVGVACSGQFEWVDSLLVKAITEGHWMLLSHANFCSSSVLDRLNPLFEPNPVLSIDERGVVNGRVLTVTPHPNFRLFLTLDPTNGHISRALRNRGVEIIILEQDIQDLCTTLESSSDFPSISDLSLTPVIAMVTRDIQPLIGLIKRYQSYSTLGITDVLKVECVLNTFLNNATMDDYNERGVALKNLTNQMLSCNKTIQIIVQCGWSLLEDTLFIETTNQIKELLQLELGCRYDGLIEFKQNKRIMGVVNCMTNAEQLLEKGNRLKLYSMIKRLSLFNILMNDSKVVHQSILAGIVSKGTVIKLSVFISCFLTSIMESVTINDIIDIDQSKMNQAVDVLTVFVYLFHIPSCTVSLFGVGWSMLKQYSIITLLPVLNNKESIISQLQSLSDLDSLTSNETKVMGKVRELMGGPTPPTSLKQLEQLTFLTSTDTELIQSSSLAPPLYLLAPPSILSRKELLNNQIITPGSLSDMSPKPLPTVYPCITQPAFYQLKRILQGVTVTTQSLLNYCLCVSQWPLQSLKIINEGCGFLPLLELSHADPYLQSLNSSLMDRCHGDASSMTSLMTLCHASFLSTNNGSTVLTLGDYNDKMVGLHCLNQFLWIQGFSVVQDTKHTISQDVQTIKHITQITLNSLQCAYYNTKHTTTTTTSTSIITRQSVTDLMLALKAANNNNTGQQRWSAVNKHFDCLFDLYENSSNWGQQELGMAKLRLGIALCILFAPTFLLDPLGVKQAEIDFIEIMEQYINNMIQSHDSHMTHLSSHTWSSLYPISDTVLYNSLVKEANYWSSLKQESQSPVLNRLIPEKFGELAGCCHDIVSNLCNYDKIHSLVCNGNTTVWRNSIIMAIHQLRDRFPTYPDLVQPFTASLTILLDSVICLTDYKLLLQDKSLYCVTSSLVQFPYVSDNECCYGDLARIENVLLYIGHLLKTGKKWTLMKKLLMVAVDTAPSILCVSMYPKCDSVIKRIFEYCHQIWKIADEKRKEREKDEQSLYKTKVVNITDENGEEEDIETVLKETFPNYEKDFEEDITDKEEWIEPKTDRHDNNHHSDDHHGDDLCEQFDENEVNRIKQLHNDWSSDHVTVTERSNVFINMYSVGVEIINKMGSVYKPGLTDIGGHIWASNDIIATNTTSDLHRSFNIYKDPNIHEVRRAQPVIQELVKRVQEILVEWPDYPVLLQIITACTGVLSVGVSEPLMKILTGLEIVLRKAQDWESYTSARLSLSKPLKSLSALILEWRKMELSYWGGLFDICRYEVEVKASQWWFYLYGLCSEGVANEEGGVTSLVAALQQLMETSTVGEYSVRLNLLKAYSIHYRKGVFCSSNERSVANALYNVYKYYSQFVPAVDNHIKDTTKPVEKDFKDNLSILRWNDGNYWAIKQTSEKSHKTLLHFMKKYHGVLNQPVKPVLTTSSIEEKQQHNQQNDNSNLLKLIKSLDTQHGHASLQSEVTSLCMDISLSGGILLTVTECYNRMCILFERFVSHGTYTGLCNQLDEFVCDVITAYHELQKNDSVPTGGDKDKRVGAVKLLMMRRKRALADLIKQLKQYGLSHRKGEELSDDLQLLTFTQSLSTTTPFSSDYDHYFYLSVARMVALTTSIGSPSKELSLYHVKCIKGYSRMLLKYLCEERVTLSSNIDRITELDNFIKRIRVLCDSELANGVLPSDYNNWQTQLSTHLGHCIEAISDTDRLLSMIPESLDLSLTPTSTDQLPPLLLTANTQRPLTDLIEWKKRISEFNEKQLKPVNNLYSFITKNELLVLEEGYKILETFSLQAIPQFLDSNLGDTQSNTLGLFEYLVKLRNVLSQACSEFREWLPNINTISSTNNIQPSNDLASIIYKGVSSTTTTTSTVLVSNNESSLLDNTTKDLIKSLMMGLQRIIEKEKQFRQRGTGINDEFPILHDTWNSTITNTKDLNIETVNNQLKSLLDCIGVNSFPITILVPLVSGVLPLLEVYKSLVHRIVNELQLCHRTVGKMTSVMLAIFMNLTSKGFCIPQEFSEEGIEGSEFMDIEAGGFDEGEGSKNVNDKVDQDNLDPGGEGGDVDKEEKDKNETDEKDNAFEMEEDFEGKMEDINEEEERKENETESGDEENEEVKKRMGEVEKGETDEKEELDRNMWAPEEEEEEEEKDMNKESGGGTALEEETQLVAKEESKRKRGDTNDDKQIPETDPVSDDEGVVNDIDEYFEAGRDTRQAEQEDQVGEPEDFGELNIEEENEECDDEHDKEENDENNNGDTQPENEEEMEITEGPPSPDDKEKDGDDEGDEEGGGEGHTEEMEDMDEDIDIEARSYANNDTVYGIPQSQSIDTNDQQKSNSDVQNVDSNNQEESSQAPITDNGTITTAVEQNNNGSVVPLPSTGKAKNRSRKHPNDNDTNTPNPVSEKIDRPIKRARLMDPTKEELAQEQKEKDTATKDSDQYQHVTENQPSDNLAWDSISNMEGGGKNPLGEEPPLDEDQLEEEGKMATDKEVSTGCEYQLLNTCDDGIIEQSDENNMDTDQQEETTNGKKEEWMKPTDSFFASADSSAWASKAIDESSLRESLKTAVEILQQSPSSLDSVQLWIQYETLTSSLSHALCEELRLILQPTQASKLKGDFRTGKRLNMRRIIPYIASNFQNDRIWLRRSKPSKREYQILLAVDDSSSMKENNCNQMAYESLAVISTALQKLECGQLGICRFGESVEVLHPLESPFSASQGGHLLHNLTFAQNRTNFVQLIKSVESLFSRCLLQGNRTSVDISQLLVVLSDGRGVYADGTLAVESGVRRLTEMGVFIVFIILDGLAKDSIVDIKVPIFVPGQPPIIKSYMETFPFPFYIVLRDTQRLPLVLGESLRQWFELVTMNT